MIEYLVHIDAERPPSDLMLATADVPDEVSRQRLKSEDLPAGWRGYPAPEVLSSLGETFAEKKEAAVLIVPSALAVTDHNWILNPAHPDFQKITLHAARPFDYDPRLLKARQ